jgi:hypothetical protein
MVPVRRIGFLVVPHIDKCVGGFAAGREGVQRAVLVSDGSLKLKSRFARIRKKQEKDRRAS